MVVFWFRRDLRLHDNKGFFEALSSGEEVLPIFIFDKNILEDLPVADPRLGLIHDLLTAMQAGLKRNNKSLAVFHGDPVSVFERLFKEHHITSVYTNHDYEPYARKRDVAVYQIFKKHDVKFLTYKDQVIFEKSEVTKDDGTPYVVYTPYSRKWKEHFSETKLQHFASEKKLDAIAAHDYPFLSLDDIGFESPKIKTPALDDSPKLIANYQETRNFPALKTSHVGTLLRFGALSIREMVGKANRETNPTYLNELIWREFFMQILWHFPHTVTKSFKPKYDTIQWRNDEAEFRKWCEGNTGYPFVDAGMRELNATGFMHNRVRMIVASFLCKHLLIDWRWGEAYFAQKLFDYEQSSNIGNWQWAAGSGVDAAPYFRIFNPTEQIKKFDKDLRYIKKWVPELETSAYPQPIVDHKMARERCLKVFKEAVG